MYLWGQKVPKISQLAFFMNTQGFVTNVKWLFLAFPGGFFVFVFAIFAMSITNEIFWLPDETYA